MDHTESVKDQNEKLIAELRILNEKLEKSNSMVYNFLLSIVKGIGVFIGATIVAGVILYALSQLLSSLDLPILESIYNFIVNNV